MFDALDSIFPFEFFLCAGNAMSSRAPPKRKRLKGIPRQQWDGVHPSPLAHQIQAQFVDKELVRYQIVQETPTRLVTYCRLPSPAQVEAHCTSCSTSLRYLRSPLASSASALRQRGIGFGR